MRRKGGEKALEQTPGAWADSRAGKQSCHFPPTIYYFLAFHFLSLFECSFKRKKMSIYCWLFPPCDGSEKCCLFLFLLLLLLLVPATEQLTLAQRLCMVWRGVACTHLAAIAWGRGPTTLLLPQTHCLQLWSADPGRANLPGYHPVSLRASVQHQAPSFIIPLRLNCHVFTLFFFCVCQSMGVLLSNSPSNNPSP